MAAGRLTAPGVGAAALLLLIAAPRPDAAVALLQAPAPAAGPTGAVVALLSLLAWLLAGWLGLSVVVTAGSQLPGRLGRGLAAAARRSAPEAVRHAVELALGMTVAVGALSAPATAAPVEHVPAAAPASEPSLDWGVPPPAAPQVDAPPVPPAVPTLPSPAPTATTPHEGVVVQPGDTLWGLAAHELASRTRTAPRDADVAQRWPDWWAANRDAVGDDPHHITPGLHLSAPPA